MLFRSSAGTDKYANSDYATMYRQVNGQHLFYNAPSGTAGNTITFTQAMTLDASGNLGIGTTTPNDRFDVRFSSGNGSVRFGVISNNNVKIYNTTGDIRLASSDASSDVSLDSQRNVIFNTANAERMRLDSSGNLGLGVTPSAWSSGKVLEIGNTGNSVWGNSTANFYLTENTYYNGGWKYASSNGAATYQMLTNSHIWSIAPSGTAGNPITFTQAMTLDASGNLGIGQSSPSYKLDVSGIVRISNGGDSYFGFGANKDNYFTTGTTSGIQVWRNSAGTEYMRIDTSGTLLCKGSNTINSVASVVASFGGGGQTAAIQVNSYNDASKQFVISNNNGNTSVYSGNGSAGVNLFQNGSSWSAFSDERIKDIIEPITDAASKVSTLRTVIGKYKTDDEGTRRPFLIAQDVQAVLPEAIKVSEDEIGTLNLSYTDIIPLLVAAIKEQQAIIEQLKADVAALKGQA